MVTSSAKDAEWLLRQHQSVSTLAEMAHWKDAGEKCIIQLRAEAEECKTRIGELRARAGKLREETRLRSFFGRFFKSSEEKQVASSIVAQTKTVQYCFSTVDKLQVKIDDTPSSKEEKQQMLSELKAQKKELQIEKRELNSQMKNIRTEARQLSASAATSFSALVVGSKYSAAERRSIRASKERALAPREDAKAALERQLLTLDREILRIESFS
jgi:chromosome segregation ATPase